MLTNAEKRATEARLGRRLSAIKAKNERALRRSDRIALAEEVLKLIDDLKCHLDDVERAVQSADGGRRSETRTEKKVKLQGQSPR